MAPKKPKNEVPFYGRISLEDNQDEAKVTLPIINGDRQLTFDIHTEKINRDILQNVGKIGWKGLLSDFNAARTNDERAIPVKKLNSDDDIQNLHTRYKSLEIGSGPKGKRNKIEDDSSKIAKKSYNAAKNYSRGGGWIEILTRRTDTLIKRDLEGRWISARLEDFLYYQNTVHRSWRVAIFEPKNNADEQARIAVPRKPRRRRERQDLYSLSYKSFQIAWVYALLNYYDEKQVGVRERAEDAEFYRRLENVPPDELHLWTPRTRRMIGREDKMEIVPIDIDLEALEKRRQEVENVTGNLPSDPTMNHSKRRRDIGGRPGRDLPSTAGDIERFTMRNTFTEAGLWISAAETSDDWVTSYDYMGPAVTSCIRNDSLPGLDEESEAREDTQGDVWDKAMDGPDGTHRSENPKRWAYATTWAK